MNFLRYKEFLTSIYIFFFSNCDLRPRERDLAYHLARYNSYSILLDIFFIKKNRRYHFLVIDSLSKINNRSNRIAYRNMLNFENIFYSILL